MNFTAKTNLLTALLLFIISSVYAQVPDSASNLIVYKTGSSELTLAWSDNSLDELGFIVQRSDDDLFLSPFTIDTVTADDTSYVFAPASTYYFRIVAYNGSGNAPASNVEFGSVDSYPGHALDFDGLDDFVSIPDNDLFSFGDGVSDSPFSIEFWVNFDVLGQNHSLIDRRGSGAAEREYVIQLLGTNKIQFTLFDGSTSGFLNAETSSFIPSTNQWYHVACTYDASGLQSGLAIYIDGVSVPVDQTNSAYTAMENLALPLEFGANQSLNFFNGQMDEVKIYNYTKTDFSDRYTPLAGNESGLIAYYSFDENAGTVLYDRSVNTNDGTITGTPAWAPSFTQTFEVTNINDSGAGSLRQAILDANASTDPFVEIGFSGLNAGDVITLSTVLPFITRPMVIDATTAIGWDINTGQMIVIDGSITPNATNGGGIRISSDSVEIYGLHIDGFSQTINLGLYSTGSYNVIGAPGKGNVITGNTQGIVFVGGDFNEVKGNYIGTDYTLTDLGNNNAGVVLTQGASYNIIGGEDPTEANFIYHNGASSVAPGVDILYNTSIGNQIIGNSMSCNNEASINFDIAYGGSPQHGIEAPYFSSITPTEISGYVNDTIPIGSEIHIYQSTDTCSNDQGKLYLGKTTVFDDGGSKKFTYSESFGNHAYSATLTTVGDGTSV
ncbi:MAG TPA: hypothetical protein DHN29_01295, partial [Cytophagales bacterium]|nr:hypothetical protein [Cytophagales bacterium]